MIEIKEMKKQGRQGDTCLDKIETFPLQLEKIDRKEGERIVLAYGETSGHAHAIHESKVNYYKSSNDQVYLEVLETALLRHEEHGFIQVPPGKYKFTRQREYRFGKYRPVTD